MVKGFEPTGQGPSNAGLVGMPVRSLLVEQAATDPEELEVEVEELDVEVVEVDDVEDDDVDDVEDDDVVEVELDDVDDVELHQPDVDVDVVLEDVELVDVHHCAQPDDTMMTVKNNDATPQINNLRTDFLFIDKSPLPLMFERKLKTTIANAISSVILRW